MLSSVVLVIASMLLSGAVLSPSRGANQKTAFPELIAIDGHTHDLVPRGGKQPRQSGIERAAAAGLRGAVLAFPLETTPPAGLLRQIQIDIEVVRAYAARKGVEIKFVDQFDLSSSGTGRPAFQILASLETFNGVFRGDPAVPELLHNAGIRSLTLIDAPGDGLSQGKGNSLCLSEFGRRVVGRMNELNIAIDISHLPEELQRDVIRTSRRPVFASHSNTRAIAPVGRNISDEILKEMCGRGGMVCLTLDREFLFGDNRNSSSPGGPRLLKHIEHVVGLCGVGHVGIGTDFLGSGENAPDDLQGFECFKAIAAALTQGGYSAETVGKILGGNLARFFSASEPLEGGHAFPRI